MTQSEGDALRDKLQAQRNAELDVETQRFAILEREHRQKLNEIQEAHESRLEEAGLVTFIRLKRRS